MSCVSELYQQPRLFNSVKCFFKIKKTKEQRFLIFNGFFNNFFEDENCVCCRPIRFEALLCFHSLQKFFCNDFDNIGKHPKSIILTANEVSQILIQTLFNIGCSIIDEKTTQFEFSSIELATVHSFKSLLRPIPLQFYQIFYGFTSKVGFSKLSFNPIIFRTAAGTAHFNDVMIVSAKKERNRVRHEITVAADR